MKVVYIAHPIRGDVARNIQRVELIVEHFLKLRGDVWPIAPYLDACRYLEDGRPGDRERAFDANDRYFRRRFIDEVWVCGRISDGVRAELGWAIEFGIPVNWDPLPAELKEALAHV